MPRTLVERVVGGRVEREAAQGQAFFGWGLV